jgi:hypothetical protein
MLVIWGRKRKLSALGRVAGFCFICREPRPHHHQVDADDFVKVSRDTNADFRTLLAETYPNLDEEMAERLEIERKARIGDLPADVRDSLLTEPFLMLNWEVEERTAETQFDRQSSLGCLGTIGAVLLLGASFLAVEGPAVGVLGIATLAAGVIGFGYTMYSLVSDPRRFVRREVYPRLALALRPSHDELTDVVARVRTVGSALAKRTKPAELWARLQHTPEVAPIEPR